MFVVVIFRIVVMFSVWFADMAEILHNRLRQKGIGITLKETMCEIREDMEQVGIVSDTGVIHRADFVIVCIEYHPETELARKAGIRIGQSGAVMVNDRMESTQRGVWAMGRSAENSVDICTTPHELAYLRQVCCRERS